MARCKITVLQRTVNLDLTNGYRDDEYEGVSLCDTFRDRQAMVIDD
jgi:hypothetical protein